MWKNRGKPFSRESSLESSSSEKTRNSVPDWLC